MNAKSLHGFKVRLEKFMEEKHVCILNIHNPHQAQKVSELKIAGGLECIRDIYHIFWHRQLSCCWRQLFFGRGKKSN